MDRQLRSLTLSRFPVIVLMFLWNSFGQLCWLNDPFEPFVKLELFLEEGNPFLKLRNDFQEPVEVTRIFLRVVEEKDEVQLLEEPFQLLPADRHYLALSDSLNRLFEQDARVQEKVIRFRLDLDPRPPAQPNEWRYRVQHERQRFTGCIQVP